MYKSKFVTALARFGRALLWLKRKLLLIVAAFMIGMGNVVEGSDHSVMGNHDKTEQEDRKG